MAHATWLMPRLLEGVQEYGGGKPESQKAFAAKMGDNTGTRSASIAFDIEIFFAV
jgi:hypothetical protein